MPIVLEQKLETFNNSDINGVLDENLVKEIIKEISLPKDLDLINTIVTKDENKKYLLDYINGSSRSNSDAISGGAITGYVILGVVVIIVIIIIVVIILKKRKRINKATPSKYDNKATPRVKLFVGKNMEKKVQDELNNSLNKDRKKVKARLNKKLNELNKKLKELKKITFPKMNEIKNMIDIIDDIINEKPNILEKEKIIDSLNLLKNFEEELISSKNNYNISFSEIYQNINNPDNFENLLSNEKEIEDQLDNISKRINDDVLAVERELKSSKNLLEDLLDLNGKQ